MTFKEVKLTLSPTQLVQIVLNTFGGHNFYQLRVRLSRKTYQKWQVNLFGNLFEVEKLTLEKI